MSQTFLVEVGTEELPPKALKNLNQAFADSLLKSLTEAGLGFGAVKSYAAPRRLALSVQALPAQTPLTQAEVWGPPANVAFKDGQPTKAALAFAEKNGLAASELQTRNDGKADKLFAQISRGGESVTALLPAMVSKALAELPIPKRMRWGAKREEFVRPVHWLVLLYGTEVVTGEVMGLAAGRASRGHRFHHNQAIELAAADQYAEALLKPGFVMADFDARQALIVEQVNRIAADLGGVAQLEPDLLDEVTALVEWPVALAGKFEERFLAVPAEALISSMGEHQKYFHLLDKAGKLMPYFITVANLESRDPTQVIDGNERVIRPRLSDAAFFFETDKKVSLEQQRERLKHIVFQAQLGTLFDKTERVAGLVSKIAMEIGVDDSNVYRAAQLSKSDLVTNMVGEFDTMQGIAGYYYALNDGEPEEVAKALNEQYLPRFAGDALPETLAGTTLALADRIDTLVGIFGIGQYPTGSKDPFALRRASVGILRLLIDKEFQLDLKSLLKLAVFNYGPGPVYDNAQEVIDKALNYIIERLRAMYEEAQIAAEVYQAVSAKSLTEPLDIDNRVKAVQTFSMLPEAQSLAAANKRVANILAKLDKTPTSQISNDLLQEGAERALAKAITDKQAEVAPLFSTRRYTEALSALASLREPVDTFFDQVMVMAEDVDLRNNRLALLVQLRNLFLEVADISLLVPAKG